MNDFSHLKRAKGDQEAESDENEGAAILEEMLQISGLIEDVCARFSDLFRAQRLS